MVVDDDEVCVKELKGDGDFRSAECIEILKQADIVVTNPPFSLFREFMATLVKHEKKFLIIGNVNALKYKEIFPLIMDDRVWLGASIHSGDREFGVPDDYPLEAASCRVDSKGKKYIRVKGVRWYTNLEYSSRHEKLPLYKTYSREEYPTYVNFDAIEVSKTSDIPMNYDGLIGVPITFMDKYNPDQFEIVGMSLELADMGIIRERLGRNDGGPTFYLERNGKLDRLYNPAKLDKEVAELMADKEVQRHGGIYEFLLSDRTLFEKLNLRTFDSDDMRVAYEDQKGVCPICKGKFAFEEMRGDHIKPWSKGGKTVPENLQMLCADCNARKSDKF